MSKSPDSLQQICVSFICKTTTIPGTDDVPDSHETAIESILPRHGVYLPASISEQLLEKLSKNDLTDKILLLFGNTVTSLQTVRIHNASSLTTKGLSVLRHHKILHLEVKNLSNLTVNDLIGCLGDWTLSNLQLLDVSHSTFVNKDNICVFVALSKLKNLCVLNVGYSDFNIEGLHIVAQDLPKLENLDISETFIRSIAPLKKRADTLKVLSMYNLKSIFHKDFTSALAVLNNLTHLDISEEQDGSSLFRVGNWSKVSCLLKYPKYLPNLTSLDISGKETIKMDDLRNFMNAHPALTFLGLMWTDACFDSMFINPADPNYNPNLVVTGCGSEAQTLEALRRYLPRRSYVQKALYNLYSYTQKYDDVYISIIQLVIQCMKRHTTALSVQLAATACLYNLTKGNLGMKIHPHLLRKIVKLTLVAMESFPTHQQLQKNALLTLCSDRILQDVTFDRYRCAELVMDSLLIFDDPSMNRMAVAICSILAAKISTTQTSSLGTKTVYMERLLNIVRSKTAEEELDIMMKFTLSALWNLTDESPATCAVFLNMGGMELFIQALKNFSGESAVETKVLGLVNNIAEVEHLKPHLMKEDFLSTLRSLLHSKHVDVSYFAAGIIAHLLSAGPELWTSHLQRENLLHELGEAVLGWEIPATEMVAYRSFAPFFPLLKCFDQWQVQLWAVWAIHHVTSKNPSRYCPMLAEEDGVQLITFLLNYPFLETCVHKVCERIMKIVNQPHLYYTNAEE